MKNYNYKKIGDVREFFKKYQAMTDTVEEKSTLKNFLVYGERPFWQEKGC
jgi:hypothetical protein